jgi:glycosyltransferase involved in cell wall biosynthesis
VPASLPALDTKESRLTLVFVGRVVPSKRVYHAIWALDLVRRAGWDQASLWIIGSRDGNFFGRVDDAAKARLLARAHALVMTSVREGWGLVVTEANALGTPAVVYNVPGLRDSTRDGETGLICEPNIPAALAHAIASLRADPALYARLRNNAWASAQELSWDRTAHAEWQVVEDSL